MSTFSLQYQKDIYMLLRQIIHDIKITYSQKQRVKKIAKEYNLPPIKNTSCTVNHEPVSVVIPALDKDLEILPLVIKSLKKHFAHNVFNITIIAPNSSNIIDFCKSMSLKFIDETKLLPIQKKDIKYGYKNMDRSGWMFQQLIKIAGALSAETEKVFICDADTIFVRKQVFYCDDGIIYDIPIENHNPYKDAYEKITGLNAPQNYSITAHHILVEKSILKELLDLIETKNAKKWWLAICDTISSEIISCHSDYDTLGFYSIEKTFATSYIRYGENGTFKRKYIWIRKIPGISLLYRTISFHSYNT